MEFSLIILFALSLIYISVTTRVKDYIRLLGVQGLVLFVIAIVELHEINLANFLLILVETLVFKAIFVPIFFERIRRKNLESEKYLPGNFSLMPILVALGGIVFSFMLSNYLYDDHLKAKYFAIAIAAIIIGIFLIVSHKQMLIHLAGYIVIENGIFLLSLAVGGDMPMIVNTGALLDIFASVLVLGIFLNLVGDQTGHQLHTDDLSELKD
ncbi:MAG TPA: hypothetical protein ENJ82_02140 [Bacteroidetes bacterium]|nr:hypothetical protein [Bacteroidota bacterium]